MRDVIIKIERDLSNIIWNTRTSISVVEFSWTTLYRELSLPLLKTLDEENRLKIVRMIGLLSRQNFSTTGCPKGCE